MTTPKTPATDRVRRMQADVKGAQLLTLEKIGVSRYDLNLETAVDRSQPHATL